MAHHEAGHAVVAHLLGVDIGIVRIGPANGEVTFLSPASPADSALVDLAGPLAHTRYLYPDGGSLTFPSEGDFASYEANGKHLACSHDEAVAVVAHTLETHWPVVDALAAALLNKGALTGAEVAQLVEERA